MLRGVVVRAFNSYYFVQTADKVVMCTLRGRFKKERFSLLVGDEVEYTTTGEEKGVIEHILPRRSMLRRPMVANVNQVILTFAAVNPDINAALVDRFLILAELSGLDIMICINKVELADLGELGVLTGLYQDIGYQVLSLSARQNLGIEQLKQQLFGRISVFAGPSGAGKSTILNAVEPGLALTTGEVSAKIGRGKHTTRFAELLPLSGGGFVVDTPGFSFTEFTDVPATELMHCFPEIAKYAANCKFTTCLHDKEPQCAVKQAVHDQQISPNRYHSYLEVLTEIREARKGF